MTKLSQGTALRIFALLVTLGVLSVAFLWTLSPVRSEGQTTFAIYLSIDLVVFAMCSYIYRVTKWKEGVGRIPILGGCLALLLLIFVGIVA